MPDFKSEGRKVDVRLLRALAMGGNRSVELQLLIDSQAAGKPDYQALSLLLGDLSVPAPLARDTFEGLLNHQRRMRHGLGRMVGIKTAAMDFLENIERALNVKDDEYALTYSQLAKMAFHDHLTGLANFRYFSTRFHEEVKRAGRYRHLTSLAMLDIDFFKQFNDKHGHPAGNKAIEQVASILRSEVRETDLVARYGGEEFALILPETTKYEAHELAERIRTGIEKQPIELPDGQGPQNLTVSLGLATYPRDAHNAEALLAAADGALYLSKHSGRNRVSLFTPPSSAHFSYIPDNAGAAQSIAVVGDFNGWIKKADPLEKGADGHFSLTLQLAPGNYAYKFVVNGEWYIADPRCTQFVHDGYGGKNSVLVVN